MQQLIPQHIIALQVSYIQLFLFICFMNCVGQYQEKTPFF